MEKLKDMKKKHDHLLTKLLKVSIFACVMLAPMFSVLAKCMYVSFNKNAKDSYSGTTYITEQPVYYETNEVENSNDLLVGNIYHYTNNFQGYLTGSYINLLFLENTENLQTQFDIPNSVNEIIMYIDDGGLLYIRYNDGINHYISLTLNPCDFVIKSYASGFTTHMNNLITYFEISELKLVKNYIPIEQQETIDNVFYYSVEQIGNEQIFSWTKQTAIYNAVNSMTNGLGIDPTNNILAVLLTYWTLNTIVYVIIDIVLELFTKLTHMI